jgi:hypothetical protein
VRIASAAIWISGAGVAHHLRTEEPLLCGVEDQLEIPVVLAGGAAVRSPP